MMRVYFIHIYICVYLHVHVYMVMFVLIFILALHVYVSVLRMCAYYFSWYGAPVSSTCGFRKSTHGKNLPQEAWSLFPALPVHILMFH